MWISLVVTLAASLAGCAQAPAEDGKLKVSLIPILDTIPVLVAQQNGYFAEQGITVEGIPVKSAQEQVALVQSGQVDGMLTDLITVGIFNKQAPRVKAVYTARIPFPGAPMFRILAAANSNIKSPADLKGVPIGISQNTVIEYVTSYLLEGAGLKPEEIQIVEVSAIPVRFEQLMNGNLKAATLPDPMAQGAIAGGAVLIVDDIRQPERSQSVLAFRVEVLKAKPNTVRKFLIAWEKAVAEINAHPEKYQSLLIEQGRVPKSIENSYKMPPFPGRGVPAEADIANAVKWMRAKGLLERDVPYQEMVDPSFLPK
ncbi:MAG: ABC transporter substrate-binding protein [Anaerolineae bacterium]